MTLRIDEATWSVLSPLLDEALDLPTREARTAWLRNLSPDLQPYRDTLAKLLDAHARPAEFLDEPAWFELRPAGSPLVEGAAAERVIGPYRLVRELGRGGMGSVWLAERVDGVLKRPSKVELKTYGPKIEQLEKTRTAALAEGEKKAGATFLAKAAAESGATKTESGAILTTLKEGKGANPKATDTVKVHYHGTLLDGIRLRRRAVETSTIVMRSWSQTVRWIKAQHAR